MRILVTGAAGFIGMHVSKMLLERGDEVLGFDNLNDYYDINLKNSRINELSGFINFKFIKGDISDLNSLKSLFRLFEIESIIHLAAQAGVRYSIDNPQCYLDSNLKGFLNILEVSRIYKVKHLVYASSSSVYGNVNKLPFSEDQNTDRPLSFYAATKKANEVMAHSYSHLFQIPTTGLRFFTAYGPWGRPDMALFQFTKSIIEGRPINVFNYGKMVRDFTYIDDIAMRVLQCFDRAPALNESASNSSDFLGPDRIDTPFRILNIGNGNGAQLVDYISAIEASLETVAIKNYLPLQPGDALNTEADSRRIESLVGHLPKTNIEEGVRKFVEWYRCYYS